MDRMGSPSVYFCEHQLHERRGIGVCDVLRFLSTFRLEAEHLMAIEVRVTRRVEVHPALDMHDRFRIARGLHQPLDEYSSAVSVGMFSR